MGKRKGEQPLPQAPEPTDVELAKLAAAAAEAAVSETVRRETTTELPPLELVAAAPAALTTPAVPTATADPAPIAATVESPKLESVPAEPVTLQRENAPPADVRADETTAADAPSLLSAWTSWPSVVRTRRLAPLAATIAIAAALGAMAGSLTTAGVGGASLGEPVGETADARALKEQVARLHADLAALKFAIDSSARSSSAQYIKLGDRLDHVEKAQAEPAARLAKLADAVDRIERRTPTLSVAAAAHDITGSVGALAPAPQLASAPETRPATPPVIEGWRVRSVYNGAALIQARAGGVMEVEPGDNLPGLGRIEAIRRQEGKWVVVTSKGLIVAR
jgi:hypothetical protein